MAELNFDVAGNNTVFINQVEQMRVVIQNTFSEYQKGGKEAMKMNDKLSFSFGKIWKSIDGTKLLKDFVGEVVKVHGEFQQLETSFSSFLKSKEEANKLMSQVMKTATESPFSVTELATGAKLLLSYGLQAGDVNNTLIQLGNIASGLGIPLERLTSLYGTVISQGSLYANDLEQFTSSGVPMVQGLADMYGVSTEKIKEMVAAGQIGFPEVQKVVGDLTTEGGQFYNMMDEQSNTLTGKINNLKDSWDIMLNKIGESQEGLIGSSVDGIQYLIDNYEQIGNILLTLIETYGIYRAACITNMILTQSFAATQMQLGLVLVKLRKAFTALTATMNLNPLVLATTAVIGLGLAMWNLAGRTSLAEQSQKKFNDTQEKFNKQQSERRQKVEKFVRIIQDETETEYAKVKAYEELQKYSPALTNAYSLEALAMLKTAESQKVLNKEQDEIDYNNIIKNIEKYTSYVNGLRNAETWPDLGELKPSIEDEYGWGLLSDKLKLAGKDLENWQEQLNQYNETKKKVEENDKSIDFKIGVSQNNLNKLNEEFNKVNTLMIAEKAKQKDNPLYVIPLRLELEFEGLDRQVQQAQEKLTTLKNQKNHTTTYQNDLENAKTDWQTAKSTYRTVLNDPASTTKEVKNAKDDLSSKEKAYKDLGGDVSEVDYEEKARQLREMQIRLEDLIAKQSLSRQNLEIELENKNRQSEINAMDDGADKVLAQMQLNHDKEIQELEREKEEMLRQKIENEKAIFDAEEAIKAKQNPNYRPKEFDISGIKLSETETASFEDRETNILQKQAKERIAFVKSEERSMKEYLTAYGDYEQKRQAIIDLAEEKKKGKNKGEQDIIDAETQKTLSDLDSKANESTSAFGKLFSDMSKRTVKDLRTIASEAQNALDFVKTGEWDPQKGKSYGMTEATFNELKISNTNGLNDGKIKIIEDGIKNVNREVDTCETSFNKMGKGFKKAFAAGADAKTVQEGLAEIEQGLNSTMQAGQFLSNALAGIGDAFGNDTMSGIADGIGVAMDAVGGAMDGAKAGAAFGPWGAAAGAAIGLVSSLSSSLAKMHDAKNEKRIQAMQEQVEVLEKSYDNLGEAIGKAYSTDASELIDQQNELLEQQKILIQGQIAEEKNKKKSDNGRIEEWQNQLESIDKQIGENKEKQLDAIMGSDLKSAIDEFAQAYADAWSAGNDRAKSSKDLVKDMIKQMIMESLKAASSKPMEELRQKLADYYKDGIISTWEREQIEKDAEAITKELDSKYGWADEYLKGEEKSTSQADSSKGGFESMSQETGSELNGRFTALQISNEEIKNSMLLVLGNLSSLCTTASDGNLLLTEMRNLAVMSNGHLEDIAKHTKVLLGFGDKLDRIEQNTGRL